MDALEEEITALSKTSTHDELVRQMQVILRQMAYYVSQSEAAVNDYREEWRDEFTERLYESAGASEEPSPGGKKTSSGRRSTTHATAGVGGAAASAAGAARSEKAPVSEKRRRKYLKQVKRTAANRPRNVDVPDSLRRLMEADGGSSSGD